jgi:hypothetical protein
MTVPVVHNRAVRDRARGDRLGLLVRLSDRRAVEDGAGFQRPEIYTCERSDLDASALQQKSSVLAYVDQDLGRTLDPTQN